MKRYEFRREFVATRSYEVYASNVGDARNLVEELIAREDPGEWMAGASIRADRLEVVRVEEENAEKHEA